MRRKDREVADIQKIWRALGRGTVVQLGINDPGGPPYVVPLNYAIMGKTLVLHCAFEGRKLDLLRRDPRVGFCVVVEARAETGPTAKDFTTRYLSVLGTGVVEEVEDAGEKIAALEALLASASSEPPPVGPELAAMCAVLRLTPEDLSAKTNLSKQ